MRTPTLKIPLCSALLSLFVAGPLAACTDPGEGDGDDEASSETAETEDGDGDGDDSGDDGEDGDTDSGDTGEVSDFSCSGWELLGDFYPGVTVDDLSGCSTEAGLAIEASLMNLEGVTISGDTVVGADGSTTAQPCVQIACDDEWAYVASNALPHYDPQAQPIFDTIDTPIVHRIPLVPSPADTDAPADPWDDAPGCQDALDMFLGNVTPSMPPSSHCFYETEDGLANTGELHVTDGETTVHKVLCYGQTGTVITGVPLFAPAEEAMPDPYGSPLFRTYADQDSLFVDLCGLHPAAITHNHWVNEACLAQDELDAPANSYVVGASTFDVEALDAADCTESSDILGWAYDGYPLMGSCVCMDRDGEGNCTDLRRARPSYVYSGLGRFGDDPEAVAATDLDKELEPCTERTDCCEGNLQQCRMYCQPLLVEGEDESVAMESRCVTADYSWCIHEYNEHADTLEDEGYAYLDRCNGIETADGYRYVGTVSFPYVNGCYRGEPSSMATDDTYIRLDMGGGGGGPPP